MSNITSISSSSSEGRSCNGCTKCSEGWLTDEVNGENLSPDRQYECLWLSNPDLVPDDFWPKTSGTILSKRVTPINKIPYIEIKEAGNRLPVEILDWAIQHVQHGLIKNIRYEVGGVIRDITSQQDYAKEMIENA